jgi:hypothetical protein
MKKFLLISVLLVAGCGYSPWSKKVNSFSLTYPPKIDQVQQVYNSANTVNILSQEAILDEKYITSGYHPGQIKNFLSNNDLKVRIGILKDLESYFSLLNKLTSGENEKSINEPLPEVPNGSTASGALSTSDAKAIIQGLDSVVAFALEYKTKRRLSILIKNANPLVQKLCNLLDSDLNNLEQQNQLAYSSLLISQNQFIQNNQNKLSPIELRNEINKLVQIEDDQKENKKSFDLAIENINLLSLNHQKLAEQQ